MLKNPDQIGASSKTWDIGSILRFISKSANSELSTTPLPFCAASNGEGLEPGSRGCQVEQKPPGVFLGKKEGKNEKNMLRYFKDPHFSITQKNNMSLSSFLEESRDYFTKKNSFWGITCFFLKPPRLDPSNPFGWGFGPEVLGPGIFFGKLSLSHIAKAVANSRWWRFS